MLAKLYKLAYNLDKVGLYGEADEIQKVMLNLAERVGFNQEDMITLADHFDAEGNVELANHFDNMIKVCKIRKKMELCN